jgi:hypothetical protein
MAAGYMRQLTLEVEAVVSGEGPRTANLGEGKGRVE